MTGFTGFKAKVTDFLQLPKNASNMATATLQLSALFSHSFKNQTSILILELKLLFFQSGSERRLYFTADKCDSSSFTASLCQYLRFLCQYLIVVLICYLLSLIYFIKSNSEIDIFCFRLFLLLFTLGALSAQLRSPCSPVALKTERNSSQS